MNATQLLETEVRGLIRDRGLDPARDASAMGELIAATVADYHRRSLTGAVPALGDLGAASKAVHASVIGLGPLQEFLDDPEVEEIWINGPGQVYVSRRAVAELTNLLLTDTQVRDLVERMLLPTGRRLDLSSPFVDATLIGGERLHVVIPDVTRRHWAVNIRKFLVRATHLNDLVGRGSLSAAAASFLGAAVAAGATVLVSGQTQAGKTTMLNALIGSIPAREHLVTCEEVFELKPPHRDTVSLQCRLPNLEGAGEVPLRRLVKETLRMRPDRVVVGEVRGAEALDLLLAMNSGNPAMATIHANSGREALQKLAMLPLLAGENVTDRFTIPAVAGAVDLVVHLRMDGDGVRRVAEILTVSGRTEAGVMETEAQFLLTPNGLQPTAGMRPWTRRSTWG